MWLYSGGNCSSQLLSSLDNNCDVEYMEKETNKVVKYLCSEDTYLKLPLKIHSLKELEDNFKLIKID